MCIGGIPSDAEIRMAYEAGKAKFAEGWRLVHNPYRAGTTLFKKWAEGWTSAKYDVPFE